MLPTTLSGRCRAMENNFHTNHCQRQHSMQFESEDPKKITYAIQLMLLKRRLGAL